MTALSGDERRELVRIYESSFPEEERAGTDDLVLGIATNRICYVAELHGALVGFAVLVELAGAGCHFLEYTAVDRGLRGHGIGSVLLRHLRRDLAATHPDSAGVIFEVEDPGETTGEEADVRRRRIQFYVRNEASVVGCAGAYRAPNLAGAGTVPFLLMWLPLPAGPATVSGRALRRCVRAILTESYGLAQDAPLVEEVLRSLTC